MVYDFAKKLHNGDEIKVKETGEITQVINTEIFEKDVFVYAMTQNGYSKLHHKEIE